MAKSLRTFVVHWADLAARLPTGGDFQSQSKRRALFDSLETDGKGILFQARAIRGIYRLLPTVSGMPDTRPMLTRGFRTTVSVVPPVAPIGSDNLDRNQFRVFLIYVWYYLKVWELLCQNPQELKGHVSYEEFEAMLTWLIEWGFKEAEDWRVDPPASFDRVCGGSPLPNEEFCDRVVRGALRDLSSADEAEERELTSRLLMRTHPHLFDPNKKEDKRHIGLGAPPVPPPGQRRPPPMMVDQFGNPGVKPGSFQRWTTQYMNDFESPSRMHSQAPSATASAAPSRAPCSQARTRAPTPPGAAAFKLPGGTSGRASAFPPSAAPYYSAAVGSNSLRPSPSWPNPSAAAPAKTNAMVHSQSLPEARQTLSGLDREALRKKLERHLEMSSTGNMRKLLRVAGGMVMGESGTNFMSDAQRSRPQRSTRFAPQSDIAQVHPHRSQR